LEVEDLGGLEDLGEGGGTFFEKKGSPALSKPLPSLPRSFLKGIFLVFYNVRRSTMPYEFQEPFPRICRFFGIPVGKVFVF